MSPTQPSPLNFDLNKPFTLSELKQVIKKLKKKKAISFDRISNKMIKSAPQVYIDQILKMFNKILILGHVPRDGVVDLSHQSIKREVNLIQIITGDLCYECLIESFMSDNESGTTSFSHKKNNTINRAQTGFMPKSSTTDHIFTLKTLCNKYVKDKKVVNYLPALLISEKRMTQYGMKA